MIEALRAGELSFHVGRVNGTIEKESDFLEESGQWGREKKRNFCIQKEGTRGAI